MTLNLTTEEFEELVSATSNLTRLVDAVVVVRDNHGIIPDDVVLVTEERHHQLRRPHRRAVSLSIEQLRALIAGAQGALEHAEGRASEAPPEIGDDG